MLKGNCLTTAMGILPHRNVDQALELTFSLDIPFWPQLPKLSFYEDMYVQASANFPGIRLDFEKQSIFLDEEAFGEELPLYLERCEDPDYFRLSPPYSEVYHRFLAKDLSGYVAVRGQSTGPVSFGFKVANTCKVPIIYNDEIRFLIFDFFARKIKAQVAELKSKNKNAFVWVDEPGLEILFTAFTGYSSEKAKIDYANFLTQIPAPKGVHLCGNPDWSFLLTLDLDLLSLDALQWGHVFTCYTKEITRFLEKGGIICWGIVPTLTEELTAFGVSSLVAKVEELWNALAATSKIPPEKIRRQAWLSPARCCLINPDQTASVERSFALLKEVSARLKAKYAGDF